MRLNRIFAVIFIIIFTTCASKSSREERILNSAGEENKYESYLVDAEQYTTGGVKYHRKYHKYLIGIAAVITEEKDLNISKGSIGFYYDKKKDIKDELYLGVDVNVSNEYTDPGTSYSEVAVAQLRRHLKEILYVVYSCRTVFSEEEIVGIVVGIRWERDNVSESANIWIDEGDVIRFEEKKLTFNELLHRNTITDTNDKIIKLSI